MPTSEFKEGLHETFYESGQMESSYVFVEFASGPFQHYFTNGNLSIRGVSISEDGKRLF